VTANLTLISRHPGSILKPVWNRTREAPKRSMPKRKNTFGDTAQLQLKTHVGFKEAATEEEKEEVYGTPTSESFH